MTTPDPISVALLTNAPAPYRTPFFNELSRHCRLLVAFETRRESNREWAVDEREFKHEWAYTRALSIPRPRASRGVAEPTVLHIPLNVLSVLNRFQPDVVVSDELGARTASALAYCRMRRRPLVVWWEGTPHSDRSAGGLKTAIRKVLLKRVTRAWGNGEESERSLSAYGVPKSRIDLGMTGIDTDRLGRDVASERIATRSELRQRYGLRGVVLLFVGSLAPRKGVRELLAALSLLAGDPELPAWSVLFVGSGPLSGEVEAWAKLHPEVPVALAGFVQPRELPRYWASGDLFVMPSLEDVWGLVCLEALVAGIPQATSSLAGAAADLITSSDIGVVIDPRDARSLADHLGQRIRVGAHRVPEDLRSRAIVFWSPEAMAERAIASIRSTVGNRKP